MLKKHDPKKREREREKKDGMPKKHDPKKREREKMACQRSLTQQ